MLQWSHLLLRALQPDDPNATCLGWLNDFAVYRFLETRFLPQTIEALLVYWQSHRDVPAGPWFAICLIGEARHVGNIKLGPIHWLHHRADLSRLIGERTCWGHAYSRKPIALVRNWVFRVLDIQKLKASIYASNIGCRPDFVKCGLNLQRTLRQEVVSAGQWLDVWRLDLPQSHWRPVL